MSNERRSRKGKRKYKGVEIPPVRRSTWDEILEREGVLAARRFNPAVKPLDSTSPLLQPRNLGLKKFKDVNIPHIQSIIHGKRKYKGVEIPPFRRITWTEILEREGVIVAAARRFNPAAEPLDSTSPLLQPRSLKRNVNIPYMQSIYHDLDGDHDHIDEKDVAWKRRRGRFVAAFRFRREYFYGRSMDKKTCIWPGGNGFSWSDDSSGTTWVGVHGNDSVCVVTKAGDLDPTRVHGKLIFDTKEDVLRKFRRTVISEVEDLADDPHSKVREMCDKSIQKPFGVVSVVPLADKVHKASSASYDEESKVMKFVNRFEHLPQLEISRYDKKKTIKHLQEEMKRDATIPFNDLTIQESSDKYDEEKAIKFLREKVERGEDFTVEGTIQIAISAFRHLFGKNFKADEIEVCVFDPNYFVYAKDAHVKDIYVKHLETCEIEHLLADINEPGSRGSSSGGSTISYEKID